MQVCAAAVAATSAPPLRGLTAEEVPSQSERQVPLKLGIRAATMKMVGDLSVVRTAAGIPVIRASITIFTIWLLSDTAPRPSRE
ncbi:MAG TPA: hypothetical protein VG146_13965 [Verrucomicrobiae bacterium]|nr:hypothetical protein [Verrucomicrobiae bacterium]